MMKSLTAFSMITLVLLCSCTQNITCVHTQGQASDVVDTEQDPTNDIKSDLSIPVKPL